MTIIDIIAVFCVVIVFILARVIIAKLFNQLSTKDTKKKQDEEDEE